MVGKRQSTFPANFANGDTNNDKNIQNGNVGLGRPRPKVFKFRDAVDSTVEDQKREQLKKKLLSEVDTESWEKFRKSKDEVRPPHYIGRT